MEKYYHNFHLSKFIHDKYNDLVISNTFRTFALSLISLFLPIYLLKVGFTFLQIAFFEIFILISSVIMHFLSIKICAKAMKKGLILSYLSTIMFYVILYNTDFLRVFFSDNIFLFIVGVMHVISISFYWNSFHLYFIHSTKKETQGSKYAIVTTIPVLLGIVSPFVGSILISKFSFKFTFLVAVILVMIGAIVLFFSEEMSTPCRLNRKKILNGISIKSNILFFIEGANTIGTGFLWPVLLYFLDVRLVMMGLFYLFSNTVFSVVSFMSGRFTDKHGHKKIMAVGSIGHGFSLIFRALSKTFFLMTFMQSLGGLFGALLFVPFRSIFYKSSHEDSVNNVMNREFYMHLGRIFIFILVIIMIMFYSIITTLIFLLIVIGIMTFGFSILIRKVD